MSKLRHVRAGLMGAILVVSLGWSAACSRPAVGLELTSYKDPYAPTSDRIVLDECAYRVDAAGGQHIAGRAKSGATGLEGGAVTRLLHVHVFWQPRPGHTFANSTGTNATLRYVVATPDGAALYTGTGFVYARQLRDGTLKAKIESARLRLESQVGTAPESLGETSLSGTLMAPEDAHATLDVVRQLELRAAGS